MRALLLDLYHTLATFDWSVLSSHLQRSFELDADSLFHGFVRTRETRSVGRHGSYAGDLAAIAAACGVQRSSEHFARLAREMTELSTRHVSLYPDVLPALREWRAAGIKLAIVSNCDHVTTDVAVALQLANAVDAVVLSHEVGFHKPHPRIFLEALERVGCTPAEAAFVDDQAAFLDGAAALGLRTFRIERAQAVASGEAGAHPVITELGALSQLLLR